MAMAGPVNEYDLSPVAPPPPRATAYAPAGTPPTFGFPEPPPTQPAPIIPRPRWQRVLIGFANLVALVVASYALFVGCIWMYEKHNDAPMSSHPDEPGKIEQLQSDQRNYNHPQLMLEAAQRFIPALRSPAPFAGLNRMWNPETANPPRVPRSPIDPATAIRLARGVSARFGAATAVLLAMAGFAAAGWAGFLAVGLAVGLCPALLSHAHFFKEDASLMFGIAVVLCAGAWALRVRSHGAKLWAVVALGVGCGLAASGKYCGAAMIGPAVVIAFATAAKRLQWGLMLAVPLLLVSITALTWTAVNYRIFDDFNRFWGSFQNEKNHSETDHYGVTMDKPNTFFRDAVWSEAMPHVKALAIAGVPLLLWQMIRLRRWGFGAWLLLTGVAYLWMLAYSVIPFYRYALPVTVMLYAFAGLAVAWAATLPRRARYRAATLASGLLVIGVWQGVRCADYTQQFADDSRVALRDWVNANLKPGTPVVVDNYTQLSNGRGWSGWFVPSNTKVRVARTLEPGSAIEMPDGLRRVGIRYVITASTTAERFLDPHVKSTPDRQRQFDRTAAFYRELQRYPIAWSRVAAHPMWTFMNPDIVVYKIDEPPTTGPAAAAAAMPTPAPIGVKR